MGWVTIRYMRKLVVVSGSIGIVVLAAAGLTGWVMTRPAPEPVNSKGGSVALDTSSGNKDGSSSGLAVGQSNGGGTQGVPLGGQSVDGNSAGSGAGSDDAVGSSGKPGPVPTAKELADYAQYKNSTEVHFIDYLPGKGVEAKATDKLVVNYTGWLGDGRKFDDTYSKGQPFVFVPEEKKVITGFAAGVVGMKVGGRRRIIVPPAGGYGAQGKDPVPPNSLLIFDVEMVAAQN